ncbi:acetoacetate decarboxylase family protein [Polaromonas jejuensis]|uniref:Acetoacetate decarboxylase family protein n=1 Tax=Polaromonas jejuensis TaxID=457502 RepID=A0ABW0QAR2_9BURK
MRLQLNLHQGPARNIFLNHGPRHEAPAQSRTQKRVLGAEVSQVKGAWSGPARSHWVPYGNAPVADLPARSMVGGLHFIAHLTLPYGRVLHDHLVC